MQATPNGSGFPTLAVWSQKHNGQMNTRPTPLLAMTHQQLPAALTYQFSQTGLAAAAYHVLIDRLVDVGRDLAQLSTPLNQGACHDHPGYRSSQAKGK